MLDASASLRLQHKGAVGKIAMATGEDLAEAHLGNIAGLAYNVAGKLKRSETAQRAWSAWFGAEGAREGAEPEAGAGEPAGAVRPVAVRPGAAAAAPRAMRTGTAAQANQAP